MGTNFQLYRCSGFLFVQKHLFNVLIKVDLSEIYTALEKSGTLFDKH